MSEFIGGLILALIASGFYWLWKQMFGEGEHEDKN